MQKDVSRREIIKGAALSTGLAALGGVFSSVEAAAKPRAMLRTAHIGAGGKGEDDVNQIGGLPNVQTVALCDVDAKRSANSFKRNPDAKKYVDYREMLDKERNNIDAVVVSIPDHSHAAAVIMAIRLGKHVYCQKPLARTVGEVRAMHVAAKKSHVVTQMGTQAHPTYIPTVELIQAGVIGDVSEVHIVTDRPIWPQGMSGRPAPAPVPETLKWDLWLGPAAEREYSPAYCPFVWRGWWDFGTGALGDMACHLWDGAYWALNLGHPTSVIAKGEPLDKDAAPKSTQITYEFPKRGNLPPVKLTWYDGGRRPHADLLEGERMENGTIFVGSEGKLMVEHSEKPRLFPKAKFANFEPPKPTIARYDNHYKQWVDACLGIGTTSSSFDYACPMTESILLGNLAFRMGKRIDWDAKSLRAKGLQQADDLIHPKYRSGYSL